MEQYRYRNLARIVIEAKTPLAIGSGVKDIITDQVVAHDVNGLPYIPGTAIAGIIRHAIGEESAKSFFGFGGENGRGSEIIFSSAQIVDGDGKIIEGLIDTKSDYLKNFDELPVRQHVRINEKGTAENRGKFDEEVVYKGARFCFEIELLSTKPEDENFTKVLNELAKDTIRMGGGTRKGFGEIEIVECKLLNYNLSDSKDLTDYINKTSWLNDAVWKDVKNDIPPKDSEGWTKYELELKPDDFFLFGSGFGDDNADMTPATESYIDWTSGKPKFQTDTILIPASSVKGALSHRVAFHYNKIKKYFVGDPDAKSGVENNAVRALFGYTTQDDKNAIRGNVLISDVIQSKNSERTKILNHVSIDRFTGGAIDGALFSESVIYGGNETYTFVLKVNNVALKDADVKKAFENALLDITNGLLPLGGGVNRGHGCFSGKVLENDKEIKRNE